MTLSSVKWVAAICVYWGVAGCTSQPPAAQWALEAQSASDRAVQAYLKGQVRVAEVEWGKALNEVSATGKPAAMARLALLQCASQIAALELTACPRYQRYAAGAAPAEQAYARYLQAEHVAADVALLPAAQQSVAAQLLVQKPVAALPQAEALSQLTAAGVALRSGLAQRAVVQHAAEVASAQGWRRAAMAWWLLEQRLAQEAGDEAAAQAASLHLQVFEESQSAKDAIKK